MNVFILNSGRCGSTTFIRACSHIRNYTAGHESRMQLTGPDRLAYPDNHIEADNRLSWLLGRLEQKYGDAAFYVHLQRDRKQTIDSFSRRGEFGIMKAWREGMLLDEDNRIDIRDIARDYLDAVETNIAMFLKDKPHTMAFHLESAKEDFRTFCKRISAEVDMNRALAEWDISYNATHPEN